TRGRFTPTCVGTTRMRSACSARLSVHPHVRGDDRVFRAGAPQCVGSPPRAWGRPPLDPIPRGAPRFTPTCVGTTTHLNARPRIHTVHPHVRGDDAYGADL